MRWFWSLYGMFGVPAELRSDGQAATLDEAKAQFETAWRRRSAWAQLTASTPRPLSCFGRRIFSARRRDKFGLRKVR